MSSQFRFSFSGDGIDDDATFAPTNPSAQPPPADTSSAFPIAGKQLSPPTLHDFDDLISSLPSKIAYGLLRIDLDGGGLIELPRRELWDVRVQVMAEKDIDEDGDAELVPGLGTHDIKTGIYEGGFKSWESSMDLVKVLVAEDMLSRLARGANRVIELGCGTALPSLALFQRAAAMRRTQNSRTPPLTISVADYNPTVLYLVTLPNFILTWALQHREFDPALADGLSLEGELELTPAVLDAFKAFLARANITLSFLSGAWSSEFVDLLYRSRHAEAANVNSDTLIIGAETIYSPFALSSFTDTLLAILRREGESGSANVKASAIVAAKRLYFGVGGSLDDFVDRMKRSGATVETKREELEGVRRAVVRCILG